LGGACLIVALPGGDSFRRDLFDLLEIRRGELHIEGRDVLFQIAPLLRARYRNHVVTLSQ
jgi:hypothetical protein